MDGQNPFDAKLPEAAPVVSKWGQRRRYTPSSHRYSTERLDLILAKLKSNGNGSGQEEESSDSNSGLVAADHLENDSGKKAGNKSWNVYLHDSPFEKNKSIFEDLVMDKKPKSSTPKKDGALDDKVSAQKLKTYEDFMKEQVKGDSRDTYKVSIKLDVNEDHLQKPSTLTKWPPPKADTAPMQNKFDHDIDTVPTRDVPLDTSQPVVASSSLELPMPKADDASSTMAADTDTATRSDTASITSSGNDVASRDGRHNDSGFLDESSPQEGDAQKKAPVSFSIDHKDLANAPGAKSRDTPSHRGRTTPSGGGGSRARGGGGGAFVTHAKNWWQNLHHHSADSSPSRSDISHTSSLGQEKCKRSSDNAARAKSPHHNAASRPKSPFTSNNLNRSKSPYYGSTSSLGKTTNTRHTISEQHRQQQSRSRPTTPQFKDRFTSAKVKSPDEKRAEEYRRHHIDSSSAPPLSMQSTEAFRIWKLREELDNRTKEAEAYLEEMEKQQRERPKTPSASSRSRPTSPVAYNQNRSRPTTPTGGMFQSNNGRSRPTTPVQNRGAGNTGRMRSTTPIYDLRPKSPGPTELERPMSPQNSGIVTTEERISKPGTQGRNMGTCREHVGRKLPTVPQTSKLEVNIRSSSSSSKEPPVMSPPLSHSSPKQSTQSVFSNSSSQPNITVLSRNRVASPTFSESSQPRFISVTSTATTRDRGRVTSPVTVEYKNRTRRTRPTTPNNGEDRLKSPTPDDHFQSATLPRSHRIRTVSKQTPPNHVSTKTLINDSSNGREITPAKIEADKAEASPVAPPRKSRNKAPRSRTLPSVPTESVQKAKTMYAPHIKEEYSYGPIPREGDAHQIVYQHHPAARPGSLDVSKDSASSGISDSVFVSSHILSEQDEEQQSPSPPQAYEYYETRPFSPVRFEEDGTTCSWERSDTDDNLGFRPVTPMGSKIRPTTPTKSILKKSPKTPTPDDKRNEVPKYGSRHYRTTTPTPRSKTPTANDENPNRDSSKRSAWSSSTPRTSLRWPTSSLLDKRTSPSFENLGKALFDSLSPSKKIGNFDFNDNNKYIDDNSDKTTATTTKEDEKKQYKRDTPRSLRDKARRNTIEGLPADMTNLATTTTLGLPHRRPQGSRSNNRGGDAGSNGARSNKSWGPSSFKSSNLLGRGLSRSTQDLRATKKSMGSKDDLRAKSPSAEMMRGGGGDGIAVSSRFRRFESLDALEMLEDSAKGKETGELKTDVDPDGPDFVQCEFFV